MTDQHHSETPGLGDEPPARCSGVEVAVSWVERLELQQRACDATRLRLIAAAIDEATRGGAEGFGSGSARELRYRSLRAELATAVALSEHQIEGQMDLATRLVHGFSATVDALERGEVSLSHGRVIADAALVIGAGDTLEIRERRAGYEAEVLDVARRETPNRLRPIARRIAERWAERPLEERHREAVARRCVRVIEDEDGMADLVATLPATQAYAIHDRLTRIARAAERGKRTVPAECLPATASDPTAYRSAAHDPADGSAGADVPRSRDQLRADAFADLLLCGSEDTMFSGSPAEAIRARVQVIAPVDAFTAVAAGSTAVTADSKAGTAGGTAGAAERSAAQVASGGAAVCELSGYGPVDPASVRDLAARTEHWDRVLSNASGGVISVDRYRPSEHMRRLLSARDRRCRFPGCRVPISRCDLDHTVDAARGGPTATDNLAHLCRGHHTLKHHGGWGVEQRSGGVLHWTSPTGRTHTDRPPGARSSPVRFRA